MKMLLVLSLLLPSVSFAQQLPAIRTGEEVRAYNDSTHQIIRGQVTDMTRVSLSIREHLDWPPTKIDWGSIDRIERQEGRTWTEIWRNPNAHKATPTELAVVDSTWSEGRLAGQALARTGGGSSYLAGAFLGGAPMGFFGLFTLCGDCTALPKVGFGVGALGVALTASRARAATRRLPPEIDRRIREMAPAYEAGFREGYREILASRYSKQIVGGSLLGMAAGFTALIYLFSMYAD